MAVEAASGQTVPSLSHYGGPGYIEMPSGFSLPDGTLAFTANTTADGESRFAATFQFSDRLQGTFRYSYLQDYFTFPNGNHNSLYDRSFDVRYRILDEDLEGWVPAVSVGLQDFGGTGVFASEYIAASKHIGSSVTSTLGIGWGRYGTHNGFENPLAIFSDRFKNRAPLQGIQNTGRVAYDRLFHGDAALFFATDWQPTPNWRLTFEYSSDSMDPEVEQMGYEYKTPFNLGARYQFDNGASLGASFMNGSTLAVSASFMLNPKDPPAPSGREPGPPAISRGSDESLALWTPRPDPQRYERLQAALNDQGITLEGFELQGNVATVSITNERWPASAQAYGRAAAVLSAQLPADVSAFRIRGHIQGMAITEVTLRRSDLEQTEYAFDGAWQSYARAGVADAALTAGPPEAWDPSYSTWLGLYATPFLFDPDNPVRADLGLELGGSFSPWQGTYLSGALRHKIVGNLDEADRPSDSTLPHVRSDAWLYAKDASEVTVPYLTIGQYERLGQDLYGQAQAGILEPMFGGVFGEMLWAPPGQRLALGGNLAYARQRDFDGGFGFQDYDVVTGFLSGFYDFGGGYYGQVDVGRYLAKDWGSTLTVSRRFGNGFELAAFATLTDVSFDEFGEGSFDKGFAFSVPLSWMTGKPSLNQFGMVIRPILRDGGAQLWVPNRLYAMTRPGRQEELGSRWERFWR
ncbi:YjbH domain-containing protein [Amaricoccus solimangrovi]|uniref:YjbH domain-containing protein n=1 Tax=Amaricoccus solimangrovi TaxID=2589815 RepID=A0A501WHX1_9RHOB|nr:YjbH domain-containing protein [Amaricoccus solimangrovi]TPE49119.1 YjbH domain-containing protein [Amaricoccus solimangrovi]